VWYGNVRTLERLETQADKDVVCKLESYKVTSIKGQFYVL